VSESKTHHKLTTNIPALVQNRLGLRQPQLLLQRGRRIAFCLEFFDQFVGTGLVLTAVTIRRCAIVESKSAGGAAKAELIVIGGSEGNCSAGAMIDFAELDACNSGR